MRFHGREATFIENDHVRVTVVHEGGHIAELFHKKQGVNPLWVPPWPTAEPSSYDPQKHPEYGLDAESKLLMGILGHNLCLDMFGPPSDEEANAGLTTHGEGAVLPYDVSLNGGLLSMKVELPLAGLRFERSIELNGESAIINEAVRNQTALDRPMAWTQHVTLGPPFLNSQTRLTFPAVKSRTFESTGFDDGVMAAATNFNWPNMPLADGETVDLRVFSDEEPFSRFTTHLMEPGSTAGFAAFSPEHEAVIGYQWQRDDFPWLGLWQENRKRSLAPWSKRGVTCGLEFGVSPYPETRRQMISRSALFDTPGYRWLPAGGSAHVKYRAFVTAAKHLSEAAWR